MLSQYLPQSIVHHVTTVAMACQSLTGTGCDTGLPTTTADGNTFQSILQILFGVLGALAVLMIVIAGLRFVTGSSSPQETAKARGTIVYALIGLLFALSAEAFVSFAIGSL
jgi:type IV secretory pathway VirB2 component (pilin)